MGHSTHLSNNNGEDPTMGVVGVPSGAVRGGPGDNTSNRTAEGDGKF
jgi:hypothetical protein